MPIPVSAGLGTTGIEFREFGIQMDAVPYLSWGQVECVWKYQPPSRPRLSNSITVNGFDDAAFKTKLGNTQVEMNFGKHW